MSAERVVEIARGELGYTESPAGSNCTKYGAAYGWDGVPWCLQFLWWCFREAGERAAFYGGAKTASCGTLLRWYREQGQTVPVEEVQVGDIVILNFHGTKDTEHCGLVEEVGWSSLESDGWIWTIEGNTTPGLEGSQDNGGSVALKTRLRSQIVAVCRPQYKPEEPQPVDDVTGHWASSSIEWAKEKGLIKGYPDGSFKPNQTMTRAEACVMFERFYQLLWEDDRK